MARPARGTLAELRPDIAAQLVDKSLADKLSVGSNTSVEWQCEKGHRWKTSVYNRTNPKNSTGCPVCSGKKVVVGYNSLADTDPEIAKLCANPDDAFKYTRASNKKILWKCEHGHTWTAPIARLTVEKRGCPVCSGRVPDVGVNDLATTHPDLAAELEDISLATKLKAGSSRKVRWVCSQNPNHKWTATPVARTAQGQGCPYCSGRRVDVGVTDLATTHPDLAKELVHSEDGLKYTAGSEALVEWRCKNHPDHIWKATIYNRAHLGVGCPICDGKQVKAGFNDLATTRPDLVDRMLNPELATLITCNSGKKIWWKCAEDPSHVWEAKVCAESRKTASHCPICGHVHRSYEEQDLEKDIRLLVGENEKILISDRKAIGPDKELDLYLPNRHFAIEFNGTYWHSEAVGADRNAHREKYIRCKSKGIQLFQIWEDDWWDRKEIVLRAIAAKLGVTQNLRNVFPNADQKIFEKLGARKTECVKVETDVAEAFLNANHIQGFTAGSYYLGLVDEDNEVRAVMVLRSPGHSTPKGRPQGHWEIARYATLGQIQGGFTKLMKYAEKVLNDDGVYLELWVSFSANNVSDGCLYEKTGFVRVGDVSPDYDYVGDYTKWHRVAKESFRKARFKRSEDLKYEDGWTEHEAALANKLYRIYDAGKVKWLKPVM